MTATIEEPKAQKLDKDSFHFEGEVLDIDASDPRLAEVMELFAEYRTRALALTAAKDAAFATEEKLKRFMGGHETLRIMGEQKVTWKWEALTVFDKQRLWREYPAIASALTTRKPDGKRVFNAKGVVGVD